MCREFKEITQEYLHYVYFIQRTNIKVFLSLI